MAKPRRSRPSIATKTRRRPSSVRARRDRNGRVTTPPLLRDTLVGVEVIERHTPRRKPPLCAPPDRLAIEREGVGNALDQLAERLGVDARHARLDDLGNGATL